MRGIGGNITGVIEVKTVTKNDRANQNESWQTAQSLKGWLDLVSGDSRYSAFNAKIQESTHIFIADYITLVENIRAENSRMVINGKRYDIMLIDNPMELGSGSQLEIYLRYTGGQ